MGAAGALVGLSGLGLLALLRWVAQFDHVDGVDADDHVAGSEAAAGCRRFVPHPGHEDAAPDTALLLEVVGEAGSELDAEPGHGLGGAGFQKVGGDLSSPARGDGVVGAIGGGDDHGDDTAVLVDDRRARPGGIEFAAQPVDAGEEVAVGQAGDVVLAEHVDGLDERLTVDCVAGDADESVAERNVAVGEDGRLDLGRSDLEHGDARDLI